MHPSGRKVSNGSSPSSLPLALNMPWVTVFASPKGLPAARSLSDLGLFGSKSVILGVRFALRKNYKRLQGFSGGQLLANIVSPTGS